MAGEALDLLVVGAVLVENCPVAELEVGEVSFLEGWHLGDGCRVPLILIPP